MDKWIIIHPTHLLPNPFMTQPAHLPPLPGWNYTSSIVNHRCCSKWCYSNSPESRVSTLESAGPDDSQCYYLLSPLSVERFPPMWSNALLLLMFGNH